MDVSKGWRFSVCDDPDPEDPDDWHKSEVTRLRLWLDEGPTWETTEADCSQPASTAVLGVL